MKQLTGYMAGANLGHWISQYGRKDHTHHDTYITAPDFVRMAEWGLDHVRLPVDYFLFEDDNNPGVYREDGLRYIDFTLEQCKKNGLDLVLDLHHAPGFFFGNGDKNDLFTSEVSQKRFIAIWEFFARRYKAEGDNLIFELLNELVWKDSVPWNALWQRTANAVHEISPERRIIVGGNYWNSVTELKNLEVVDDPRIIYNFHCYLPMIFTHQRAGWMPEMVKYTKPVHFPFAYDDYADFFGEKVPQYMERGGIVGKEYLRKCLAPAVEFIEKNDRPLYCGEYGVIANAPIPDTINWLDSITALFAEYGIGHAVWSYRGFANVTDAENRVVSEDIIRLIARH